MSLSQGVGCLPRPDAVELGILLPHLAGAIIEGAGAAAGLLLVLAQFADRALAGPPPRAARAGRSPGSAACGGPARFRPPWCRRPRSSSVPPGCGLAA